MFYVNFYFSYDITSDLLAYAPILLAVSGNHLSHTLSCLVCVSVNTFKRLPKGDNE